MTSEKIILPYGRETVAVEIEEGHLAGVLRSGIHGYKPPMSGDGASPHHNAGERKGKKNPK